MEIKSPCVVSLTWVLKDGVGEVLDELNDPVDFLIGGNDLLSSIENALAGYSAGADVSLHLEPLDAFGDYDEKLVFWIEKGSLERQLADSLQEGMLLQKSSLPAGVAGGISLPDDAVFTVTEVYPKQIVIDANHPLAGVGLNIDLKVHKVRPAREDELEKGSAGVGFFRLDIH